MYELKRMNVWLFTLLNGYLIDSRSDKFCLHLLAYNKHETIYYAELSLSTVRSSQYRLLQ